MSNQGLYIVEAGYRSVTGGLLDHILHVHRGGADSGNEQVYVVEGTGRGAGGRLTQSTLYFLKLNV